MSYIQYTSHNIRLYFRKGADVIRLYMKAKFPGAAPFTVPANNTSLEVIAKHVLSKGLAPTKPIVHDTDKNTFIWSDTGVITRLNKTTNKTCTLSPTSPYTLKTAVRMLK